MELFITFLLISFILGYQDFNRKKRMVLLLSALVAFAYLNFLSLW